LRTTFAIDADRMFPSILLWACPATGKTNLAGNAAHCQLYANTTKSHFETLSAVLRALHAPGKADLRVIEDALERRGCAIFDWV
jgi:replication-associated recombination protein RarA